MDDTSIDKLSIEIEASSNNASSAVEKLTQSLSGLNKVLANMPSYKKATNLFNGFKSLSIPKLGDNQNIQDLSKNSGIPELANSLSNLEVPSDKIQTFNDKLAEIPDIKEILKIGNVDKFRVKIEDTTKNITNLGTETVKTTVTFTEGTKKMEKSSDSFFTKLTKGSLTAIAKLGLFSLITSKITSIFSNAVTESNAYVENLNLFNVVMGTSIDKATEFKDTFSEALGVDPSKVMRYMGFFQQLGTGFGLATDRAYILSENLTELTYDLSSFINLPVEQAFEKLKSGLAGKLICLLRKGLRIRTYLIAGKSKQVKL